jgi:asparagine synthetase B (glutamine-hydrolysing)
MKLADLGHLAYSHTNQALLRPRSFAAKDEIFCLFEGVLDNLGRLSQQHGLSKGANEVVLVIEAYKTLRDRAPYPASFILSQLTGSYAFVLFDKSTNSLLVASDPEGKVPLFWGITADGCVAFSDDIDMLKGSCGKSLAPFPQGCFYSNALGVLKCYENPKNKVTAVPANEEEICGATFKVKKLVCYFLKKNSVLCTPSELHRSYSTVQYSKKSVHSQQGILYWGETLQNTIV